MKTLLGLALTLAAAASAAVAAEPADQHVAATVAIESATLRARFDQRTGALASLVDRATGREFIAPAPSPLFVLGLSTSRQPQKVFYLSSTDSRAVRVHVRDGAAGRSVRLDFADVGGRGVSATVIMTAQADDPMLRFGMSVTVPHGMRVEMAQVPVLGLRLPLGDDDSDDAVVVGRTKGGVFHRPDRWRDGTWLVARQPGSLAAQFACFYDPRGGLLVTTEDPRGYPKSTILHRTGHKLTMTVAQHTYAAGRFRLGFTVALAAFHGTRGRAADWRDAADIYKRWASRQSWCARRYRDRPEIPGWMRAGPAMVRFNRAWLAEPERIVRWLDVYWRRHFPAGVPLIVALWGWEKHETWVTPDYFPVFPSDEKFKWLAEEVRKRGGHLFLWPSGYHYTLTFGKRPDGSFQWDDRERFEKIFAPHAVWTKAGEPYRGARSWLRGGETACMCPGDPWTIDWLNKIAVNLCRRGAELIQIDQVVGGSFQWCYASHHPHPPGPGPWMTDAFRRQLRTMLAACRAVQPDAVIGFEEPNEYFIQQVGIQDYRDTEVIGRYPPAEPASVFGYLYHEYLPCFQSNPRAGDTYRYAHCLVTGQIPHIVPRRWFGPGPLLVNGGFEQWAGGVPSGWDKVPGWRDKVYDGKCSKARDAHSGRWALLLENQRDAQIVQVAQNVAVGGRLRPGQRYRVSAWMKAEGLRGRMSLAVAALARGPGVKVCGSGGATLATDARQWQRVVAELTLPDAAATLRIMPHLDGPGRVWVDDVRLEEVRADGSVSEVQRPEVPPEHPLVRRWVELFHGRGRDFLLFGEMVHPPRVEVGRARYRDNEVPAVLHNAFRAPDGRLAVVLANWTQRRQRVAIHVPGGARVVELEPLGVRLLPLSG